MEPGMYLLVFAGLMAGFLTASRGMKWLVAVWVVAKERQRDPAHRSRWRVAVPIFLNSGPWIIAALITVGVATFHRQGWSYFFGGVLLGLLIQGFLIVWFLRKIHRIRAQKLAAGDK